MIFDLSKPDPDPAPARPRRLGAGLPWPADAARRRGRGACAGRGRQGLRYAFAGSETGFDPAQISDLVLAHWSAAIFDAPLTYDYLARPLKLKARATDLPEVNADHTRFVFRVGRASFRRRPGLQGPAARAGGGRLRLQHQALLRPAVRSPTFHYQNAGLLGLSELRQQAIDQKTPFDYDREVEGLRALDRYTFEVRTSRPAPRLPYVLADARAVGRAGARGGARQPGTGDGAPGGHRPVRAGRVEAQLAHRAGTQPAARRRYDEQPAGRRRRRPGHRAAAERPAPADGRPRGVLDHRGVAAALAGLPERRARPGGGAAEFATVAFPERHARAQPGRGHPACTARRCADSPGMSTSAWRTRWSAATRPSKVALRRAIALAYDATREIELVRKGPGDAGAVGARSAAGQRLRPGAEERDERPRPGRAKALLDLYGYVDRDGDGWREQPDGSPLRLEYTTQPDQQSPRCRSCGEEPGRDRHPHRVQDRQVAREHQGQPRRQADDVGRGLERPPARRRLPSWTLLYGPNKGQANHARFDLPAFNALYERSAAARRPRARRADGAGAALMVAYMPYKVSGHRICGRPDAALGGRLQAATLHARLLALRRRRARPRGGPTVSAAATPWRWPRPAPPALAVPAAGRAAARRSEGAARGLPGAETGFDPVRISDLYSRTVTRTSSIRLYPTTTWRGRSS
jgi:hypothetical protein